MILILAQRILFVEKMEMVDTIAMTLAFTVEYPYACETNNVQRMEQEDTTVLVRDSMVETVKTVNWLS